jgi:hypothetical protein
VRAASSDGVNEVVLLQRPLVTQDVSSLPPLAGGPLSPLDERIVRLLLVSGPLDGEKIAAKLGRSYDPDFKTVLSAMRQWGVLTLGAEGYAAALLPDLEGESTI